MPQKIEKKEYNSASISQVFLSLFLLLLAFFVFLNSISSFEKNKSYDVAKSVRANFANFAGKGDNVDLIGMVKNDKINVNTVKILESIIQPLLRLLNKDQEWTEENWLGYGMIHTVKILKKNIQHFGIN